MNLVAFNYNTNVIRTQVTDEGEPLFCLADICKVLELSNPSVVASQIKEEFETPKLNLGVIQRETGPVEAAFITEPQLYFVMMRSRSENARPFRQWVVNDVLPSIRKTGAYQIKSEAPLMQTLEVAKLILEPAGITGNQLTLSLDKIYKAKTGESVLALAGVELTRPQQCHLACPTEIGKRLAKIIGAKSISGQAVNKILAEKGYQERIDGVWTATEAGKAAGATYLDVNKARTNGTLVTQMKWPIDILDNFTF